MCSALNNRSAHKSGHCSRRRFLSANTSAAMAGALWLNCKNPLLAAMKQSDALDGALRVTDIEVHEITDEFVDWEAYQLNHYYGPWKRTIYVAHTNTGLVGLGESGSPESQETIEQYIGTSPFDWVGDETSLGLGTAM